MSKKVSDPIYEAHQRAEERNAEARERLRVQREKSDARLAQIVPLLKQQIMAALQSKYFDEKVWDASPPGLNATTNAVAHIIVKAKRKSTPPAEATVDIDISYTYGDLPSIGTFDRLNCSGLLMKSNASAGQSPRPFPVKVKVEPDGTLTFDGDAMKAELVKLIG
jgi:hypothetical protein